MKKFTLTGLVLQLLGAVVMFSSCIKDNAEGSRTPETGPVQPFLLKVTRAGGDAPELTYELYIFRSIAGNGQYKYSEKISPVEDGMRLKLSLAALETGDYRFLFTAMPSEGQVITVKETTGAGFGLETTWEQVRLAAAADSLSIHSYYGVTDMAGTDIISAGTINGNLTRIVGQPVFDFYKVSDDSDLSSIIAIDESVAETVLDRVHNIDVRYENVTTEVSIAADGTLIPAAFRTADIVYAIVPDMNDTSLRVFVSEGIPAIEALGETGGVRIKGYPMLPSGGTGVKAYMTFGYYDTTPACSVPPSSIDVDEHTHAKDCFRMKELSLVVPKNITAQGLTVKSDTYTVTRAGLRCNRIIDVPAHSSITIDTDWDFPAQ